jgi:hypothetical protein
MDDAHTRQVYHRTNELSIGSSEHPVKLSMEGLDLLYKKTVRAKNWLFDVQSAGVMS